MLGKQRKTPPVTSLTGCCGAVNVEMQRETGLTWPDALRDTRQMAKLAIAAYEIGGIENVKIPFDNVIEAEALGCPVHYQEKMHFYPVVIEHPYKDPGEMKEPEGFLKMGRVPVVLEAIRRARDEVGDYLPISSHVVGPFTLAGELIGLESLSMMTLKDPAAFKKLIDFATSIIIQFAKAQYRSGSDIVTVADGALTPVLTTKESLNEIIKPALITISESLGGLRMLYIGGKVESMVPFLVSCGYDAISVDESVNIRRIKPIVGDVKILGTISSKRTLVSGSLEEVKAEVKKSIEDGADFIEPSCGVPPETPTVNIRAMVEAVREYDHERSRSA